ncbi:MAG: LuxR C-terminal-related transcriptional regulator [Parvularculaceae bacterium]
MKKSPSERDASSRDRQEKVIPLRKAPASGNRTEPNLPSLRPDAIHRPALLSQLDEAFHHKLILLEGPAGYGKTYALTQWAEELQRKGASVYWTHPAQINFALDDLPHFLQKFRSERDAAPHSENRLEGQYLLIIDEYHLISSSSDRQISYLIDNLQTNERLALAVRRRPRISWAKRFASGEARIINIDSLKFSSAEIEDLLAGQDLTENKFEELEKLLLGWPAAYGFLKTRIDEEEGEYANSDIPSLVGDIQTYLCEEVFDDLPVDVQEFMLKMSVVKDFTCDLALRLSGRKNSAEILRKLTAENLFIAEISRGPNKLYDYQFHPAFRNFLQQQLLRKGEALAKDQHRRAAKWYTKQNDLAKAAYHSALASDIESTANIIETAGAIRIGMREGIESLSHYLSQIPMDVIHNFPRIELAHVYYLLKGGRIQEALVRLETYRRQRILNSESQTLTPVESELEEDFWIIDRFVDIFADRPLSDSERENIERLLQETPSSDLFSLCFLNILLYFSSLRRGYIDDAIRMAEECRLWCENVDAHYWSFYSNLHMGGALMLQGHIRKAHARLNIAPQTAADMFVREPTLQVHHRTLLAATLLEEADIKGAEHHIRGFLDVVNVIEGWFELLAVGLTTAAAIRAETEGLSSALTVLEQACRVADKRRMPRLRIAAKLKAAELCSLHNNVPQAIAVFQGLGIDWEDADFSKVDGFTWRERVMAEITRARMFIQTARIDQAVSRLDTLIAECELRQWSYFLVKAQALRALALNAVGKQEDADLQIYAVMHACLQSGLKRIIIEEGAPMQRLLRQAVRQRGLSAMRPTEVNYISELLLALNPTNNRADLQNPAPIFTDRELEILAELTKGNSNKVIARNLGIESNTVKFHLQNIYQKLGVNRRQLAITLAQRLSLLNPNADEVQQPDNAQ